MGLISFFVSVAVGIFWIWMFWEMINNDSIHGNARLYWLLGFIFLSLLAAGYYYFTEYSKA
jgi:hypothetical protein